MPKWRDAGPRYNRVSGVRAEEKKHRPCLGCGRMILCDRGHRICSTCSKRNALTQQTSRCDTGARYLGAEGHEWDTRAPI